VVRNLAGLSTESLVRYIGCFSEMVRKKATFKGMVQGVGFRHFVYHTCNELSLSGFVKNCIDGSVVAEIQGERVAVERAIEQIKSGPAHSHVESVLIEDIPTEKENGFRVSF